MRKREDAMLGGTEARKKGVRHKNQCDERETTCRDINERKPSMEAL